MEEQFELKGADHTHAMSRALQWLCNPRGGNNLYGRLINGCGLWPKPEMSPPTIQVILDMKGRHFLGWHPAWFEAQDGPFQMMLMVHEAAHLGLVHLEQLMRIYLQLSNPRQFRRLDPVFQVAMDMEVNDTAVRAMLHERSGRFNDYKGKFLWPEDRKYPAQKTFIEYFNLLIKDLETCGFDPDYDREKDIEEKIEQAVERDKKRKGRNDSGKGGEKKEKQTGAPGAPGAPGNAEEPSLPGDKLGNEYPGWFKQLVNSQHPHVITLSEMLEQMTDAEIERAIDQAHREARKIVIYAVEQTEKSRGTIPAQFKNAIRGLLEEPTIPWQLVVQGMMKSELSSKIDESTAYPNPALLTLDEYEPYPGYQKDFSFYITVGIDTSGSVGDDEFKDFMSEIFGIMKIKEGVTIRLVMFDAGLQFEKVLEPSDQDNFQSRSEYYRYGYGGTNFEPFLRYVSGDLNEELWVKDATRDLEHPPRIPDLVVLLTDGYAPVGPNENGPIPMYLPNCPLIWCLTANGKDDPYMQPRVVRINR